MTVILHCFLLFFVLILASGSRNPLYNLEVRQLETETEAFDLPQPVRLCPPYYTCLPTRDCGERHSSQGIEEVLFHCQVKTKVCCPPIRVSSAETDLSKNGTRSHNNGEDWTPTPTQSSQQQGVNRTTGYPLAPQGNEYVNGPTGFHVHLEHNHNHNHNHHQQFEGRRPLPSQPQRPIQTSQPQNPQYSQRPSQSNQHENPQESQRPPQSNQPQNPQYSQRPSQSNQYENPQESQRPPQSNQPQNPQYSQKPPQSNQYENPQESQRPPQSNQPQKPQYSQRPSQSTQHQSSQDSQRPPPSKQPQNSQQPKRPSQTNQSQNPKESQRPPQSNQPQPQQPPQVNQLQNSQQPTISLTSHRNFRLLPRESACGVGSLADRITEGEEVSLGEYPWMALTGLKDRYGNYRWNCGGTLINNLYVLTAAHCLVVDNRTIEYVRLGEHNLRNETDCYKEKCLETPEDIAIAEVIPHERWNTTTIKNDIALLRLSRNPLKLGKSNIHPICLPVDIEKLNITSSTKYKVAGWGKTDWNADEGSDVLRKASLSGVSWEECNICKDKKKQQYCPLADTQICVQGWKAVDVCKGDSGGPLMVSRPNFYQIGITSFKASEYCGAENIPSIFTKVESYMPWILDNIRE